MKFGTGIHAAQMKERTELQITWTGVVSVA